MYKDLTSKFEHRVDSDSLRVIYDKVKEVKPKIILQIGCWHGGTTCVIACALKENGNKFRFVASELLKDKMIETKLNAEEEYGVTPEMVGDITKELPNDLKEIDFLFHDTDHDLETTQWVLDNVFPRLKDGATVIFHDWAIEDIDGEWRPKDGAWPETVLLTNLHNHGKLPLKKVYWNYHNPAGNELGVFLYEKT